MVVCFRFLILLVFVSSVIPACGSKDLNGHLNMIVGDDNLIPVQGTEDHLPETLRNALPALGHLNNACTAFHVGDGIVLSAAHCFAENIQPGNACLSYSIRWTDGKESSCTEVLYKKWDDQEDLIAIAVAPAPDVAFPLATKKDLTGGDALTLIGFPSERDLSVAFGCKALGPTQDQLRFEHDCDSLPGNSGSPVLLQNSRVLGIHNGSSEPFNYATNLQSWQSKILSLRENYRVRNLRQGENLRADNFGNNENRLLVQLSDDNFSKVRFNLKIVVENGYDFITIRDGSGKRKRYTGEKFLELELPAPVLIAFESDYAGESQMIELDLLQYLTQ